LIQSPIRRIRSFTSGGNPRVRSFRTSNAKLRGIGWVPEYRALEQGLRATS